MGFIHTGKCEWHWQSININDPMWATGRKNIEAQGEYRALGT